MPAADLLALLVCRRDTAELIEGLIEDIVQRVEAQMDAEEERPMRTSSRRRRLPAAAASGARALRW